MARSISLTHFPNKRSKDSVSRTTKVNKACVGINWNKTKQNQKKNKQMFMGNGLKRKYHWIWIKHMEMV